MNNKKSILAGLIGLALLAGCSQAPDTADKHSGLALANMDTRVKPGDDFFRYVNGHWLATAKIPDDRPADGAFYMLRDKSLADVRVLVEGLDAKAPPIPRPGRSAISTPAIWIRLVGMPRAPHRCCPCSAKSIRSAIRTDWLAPSPARASWGRRPVRLLDRC